MSKSMDVHSPGGPRLSESQCASYQNFTHYFDNDIRDGRPTIRTYILHSTVTAIRPLLNTRAFSVPSTSGTSGACTVPDTGYRAGEILRCAGMREATGYSKEIRICRYAMMIGINAPWPSVFGHVFRGSCSRRQSLLVATRQSRAGAACARLEVRQVDSLVCWYGSLSPPSSDWRALDKRMTKQWVLMPEALETYHLDICIIWSIRRPRMNKYQVF